MTLRLPGWWPCRVSLPGPPPPEVPEGSLLAEGHAVAGVPERGVHFAALCSGSFPSLPGPWAASPPTWLPFKDRWPGVLARGGSWVSSSADEFACPLSRVGQLFRPFVWPEGPRLLSLASHGGIWPPQPWGAGPAGLGGRGGDRSQGGLASLPRVMLRKRGARVDFPRLAGGRGGVCLQLGQRVSLCPPPRTPRLRCSLRGFSVRGLPGGAAAPPSAVPPGGPGLRFLTDPAG